MAHRKEPAHASPLAVSYAQSVLDLANEKGQAEAVGEELTALKQIVDENPSFREVLTNPSISHEDRSQLLDRIFRNKISPLLFNTLGVLNQHGRLGLLDQMASAYDELIDEQLGKVEVDLTVAQRLTPDQLDQARQRISAAIGRDAVLHQYVDENIIGGVVIRVGDKLIDASVKQQLAAIRQQLLAAAPK
jgi:F-type H+-transporting ATPase subunit delta